MAGQLMRILPRTDFVMTQVGTTAIETPLGALFDITPFVSLILVARVMAKTNGAAGAQTLNVFLRNTAPTPEDPLFEYVGATIATATFTMHTGGTGPQTPQIVSASGAMSYKARLVISCTQVTITTAFTFSLSCDALGRE